jgi:lysozyme
MLGSIEDGQYGEAAVEMLDSLWAQQTPERAKRLAKQMLTGEWV